MSAVIVDGVPKGKTPKSNVRVSPGTHTVVFVHAKSGKRKVATVSVGRGDHKTIAVRF